MQLTFLPTLVREFFPSSMFMELFSDNDLLAGRQEADGR